MEKKFNDDKQFSNLDVFALNRMITERDNFILLDVREPEEFEICHIGGSILAPYSEIKDHLKDFDLNRVYVVYCKEGDRSTKVISMMDQLGFQNLYNLDGVNIKNKKIKIIGTTLSNKFVEKPIKTLNKKTKNILFIGRLSPEKNIDEVVKAAKEIDHLNFFIAGDGPLREYILKEEKKYKNMIYLGWVQRENIIETIDKADIIILPSSFETFGTAALEGMSRGKLVIVSEETGIIEWPNLKNNLFILKKNENISEIIKNIDNLPENIQQEKSINAAISAKSHNNTAINTWLELLTEKKLTV